MPSDTIHEKEVVGRRAFGADKHIFSKSGSVLHYKIDVFLDNRVGTGLSIDRLGVGQIQTKIVRKLDALGHGMSKRTGKEFRGWATFPVFDFRQKTIPTMAIDEDNPYHAEILRDGYQDAAALRSLAFHLCVLASSHKFQESLTPRSNSEAE